tara:strand:+ start:2902 stop:3051 length:150 start_codon:yes stop_codon:yes gene_type:complete
MFMMQLLQVITANNVLANFNYQYRMREYIDDIVTKTYSSIIRPTFSAQE